MKKIVTSLALCLAGMTTFAQSTIFNNPDNKGYFGIRVGGENTCPGDIKVSHVSLDVFKVGGGVEFGGIYNAPIVANLYVEPGLNLYYNAYSAKNDTPLDGVTFKKFGMRVPVSLGYHFDFTDDIKVSVFTGPELEVGFTARECLGGESASLYSDEGGMNRVDLLWGFGAGITYDHFYFGVKGNIGMLDLDKGDESKFHENRVTFSLGYNF